MKKLNVLGSKVSVKIKKIDDSLGYAALYDPSKKEIILDPRSSGLAHSFLHEFFHFAWDRYGLNQTDIPLNLQELICENFASALNENLIQIIQIIQKLNKIDKTK
jgi:hypothetical protein